MPEIITMPKDATAAAVAAPAADPPPVWDIKQVSTVRSLAFFAVGAVIGLGIAGFGLFTAAGTASKVVPPEMVALVNQKPILRSDFVAQLEALYTIPLSKATRAQKQQILNDMIREELFVQRGLELDEPGTDADTHTAIVAAVEQQVSANVTASTPTDADLLAFYNARKADYVSDGSIMVDELLLPAAPGQTPEAALAKANEAAKALRAGQAPAAVAAKYGLKETKRVNGEEFNFAAEIHLGTALYKIAAGLNPGQVSDPVVEADGLHILKVTKNIPSVPLDFAQARDRLIADYKKDAQERVQKADAEYLRSKAQVLIQPEFQ